MDEGDPPGFYRGWSRRHLDLPQVRIGFRNGFLTGVRIRMPYVIQNLIYLAVYRDPATAGRLRATFKAAFHHGRNLALYVLVHKLVCHVLRKYAHVHNGSETLVAGFLGGFTAFGESAGASGAVNYQLTLYLFVRAIMGYLTKLAGDHRLPDALNVARPLGFRVFAGVALATSLYMTEHQPQSMQKGFMSTMHYLYYDSDDPRQSFFPQPRFWPIYAVVLLSLLGPLAPQLRLDSMLDRIWAVLPLHLVVRSPAPASHAASKPPPH